MTDPTLRNSDDSGPNGSDDAAFIDRIALPLRRPEQLDITFEARVMSAVHAEARAGSGPGSRRRLPVIEWWLKPRVLRGTPLLGLAAAAALVGLTLLGSQTIRSLRGPETPASIAASVDT